MEAEYKLIFVHIDKYMVIFIKDLSLTPVAHRLSDRTGSAQTPLDWSGDEVGRTSTDKECLEFLFPKGSYSPHDLQRSVIFSSFE